MISRAKLYLTLSLLQAAYLFGSYWDPEQRGGVLKDLENADRLLGFIADYRELDGKQLLYYQILVVMVKNLQK